MQRFARLGAARVHGKCQTIVAAQADTYLRRPIPADQGLMPTISAAFGEQVSGMELGLSDKS